MHPSPTPSAQPSEPCTTSPLRRDVHGHVSVLVIVFCLSFQPSRPFSSHCLCSKRMGCRVQSCVLHLVVVGLPGLQEGECLSPSLHLPTGSLLLPSSSFCCCQFVLNKRPASQRSCGLAGSGPPSPPPPPPAAAVHPLLCCSYRAQEGEKLTEVEERIRKIVPGHTTVSIYRVASKTTLQALEKLFVRYGELRDIQSPPQNPRSTVRGPVLLEYLAEEDAEAAIYHMAGYDLDGMMGLVNRAAGGLCYDVKKGPRSPPPPPMWWCGSASCKLHPTTQHAPFWKPHSHCSWL